MSHPPCSRGGRVQLDHAENVEHSLSGGRRNKAKFTDQTPARTRVACNTRHFVQCLWRCLQVGSRVQTRVNRGKPWVSVDCSFVLQYWCKRQPDFKRKRDINRSNTADTTLIQQYRIKMVLDYRCEYPWFPVSTICVPIPNTTICFPTQNQGIILA